MPSKPASSPSRTLVAGSPIRLFYLDDSGAVATGFIVYSWIEVTADDWRAGLRSWLMLRKSIARTFGVPPSHELHATKFVGGRQLISTDPAVNQSKAARRRLMEQALQTIGSTSVLRLGTCYRKTPKTGPAYAKERAEVYSALIQHLDSRLATDGELGLVFMDGDGSEPGYRDAHRDLKLATRRIIEDPLFQGSHISQWVQMADLVAWTNYQGLLRHPGKQFAWNWAKNLLSGADVNSKPIRV
ncbi:MAG: DUF3800 domain-containing protein [Bifidobacteriaceae bacterium]|nr:DUF3800 domain-containing protein [Bifidobacteriaceae bacterium]